MRLFERMRLRRAVKEAMDNLPEGICFFNSRGLPVLCNRRMHELVSAMTGRDLQVITDLEQVLTPSGRQEYRYTMPDGSAWSFTVKNVPDMQYTCVTAFDITDLCTKQESLRQANISQQQTLETLGILQKNVVSSTHGEEVLALKMRLHNDLGYDLHIIRRLMERGFSAGEKARFISEQREVLQKLCIREEQSTDPLDELMGLAEALDMRIGLNGPLPGAPQTRVLLSLILRECLINTARHAHGDSITVFLRSSSGMLHAEITNNGYPPESAVRESGGLSSLRRRIEGSGGTMLIESAPVFRLIAELPEPEQGGNP